MSEEQTKKWVGIVIEDSITITLIGNYNSEPDKLLPFGGDFSFKYKKIFAETNKNSAPFDVPIDKSGIIHFRIRENYEYLIEANGKKVICPKSDNKWVKWKDLGDKIIFSVSGFLGVTRLQIDEDVIICLEVVPTKIDYDTDFRLMTEELTELFSQLLLEWNTPTYLAFSDSSEKGFESLYEQFVTIKHLIESEKLSTYIEIIKRNPHQKLVDESKWEPSYAANMTSFFRNPLKNGRDWNTKTRIPDEIYSTKRKISIDTPPNQFVKYTIFYCLQICNSIMEIIESDKKKSFEIIKSELIPVIQNLEAISSSPFFKEINIITRIPFENQTLQKRTGYREILRAWIGIQLAKIIDWEDRKNAIDADVKNVAKLYEFWLFFKLRDIIKKIKGVRETGLGIFKSSKEGLLNISLKEGKESGFDFVYENENGEFNISLYFNRTFSKENKENRGVIAKRGSYSRIFRPDYTIVFYSGAKEDAAGLVGTIAYLHFDAKYRLDDDFEKLFKDDESDEKSEKVNGEISEEQKKELELDKQKKELDDEETETKVNRTYKRGDLYKMHTYNDAILKTVGSYVLYPGDISESDKNKKYFTAYHEILPGVGAFAIKPVAKEEGETTPKIENEHLKKFIEDCFKIQASKFSQLYMLQHHTHEIVNKKPQCEINEYAKIDILKDITAPPSEITVALGYQFQDVIDKGDFLNTTNFYFHGIKQKNKVKKNFPHEIYQAKYLFIYTGSRNKPKTFSGYYSEIVSIQLKHKSTIPGKETFSTEFYYCVELKHNFMKINLGNRELNTKFLFDENDKENVIRINSFRPAITTLDRVLHMLT